MYRICHSWTSSGTMSFKLFKLKVNKKLKSLRNRKHYKAPSILLDFCEYTNLHGFNSLLQEIQTNQTQPNFQNRIGLVIWFSSILCGIIFAIYLVALVLVRYRIHPTMMTIETNYLETWQVDFPGVTICNVNAIYKPKTLNLTKEL